VPLYIRQIVNDIRQTRPAIKVRGVDSQSDPKTAEVLNGIVRAIEADSSAESAYDWAAECAVKTGEGYWRILTEYEDDETFNQVIKVKRIRNLFSCYVDPSAVEQDSSDMKWAFVVERMPRAEFEAKYPNATGEWDGDNKREWFSDDHVRVAEYWEKIEEQYTLYLLELPPVILPDGTIQAPERVQEGEGVQGHPAPDDRCGGT
jgi:hypothetical protein